MKIPHPIKFARFSLAAFIAGSISQAAPVIVSSQDGGIQFTANVNASGHLVYTVTSQGRSIIDESALGITVSGSDLGGNAVLGKSVTENISESYPWRGVHSTATDHHNGAAIEVTSGAIKYSLEARVYNDGVAFRYVVPGTGVRTVAGEATSYQLPDQSKIWWQPMMVPGYRYEQLYSQTNIANFTVGAKPACLMTVELPSGGYAAFTEGNVVANPGMYYVYRGNRTFQTLFSQGPWPVTDTIRSPFRIIMIAKDLNQLVNCDIVHNVCPPPSAALAQADWIQSGVAVWNWVQNRDISLTNMKRYSMDAGKLGFLYNTVDAGWEDWPNAYASMKELVDYSKTFNVKIFAWKRWTEMDTQAKRKDFFQKLNDAGVVGIKVDGIDSDGVVVNDFFLESLKDAVDYKIMILFHGCPKPNGLERTWPNEIGREAIRGMENKPPWSGPNTTLPFTRLLGGHADFTPLMLTMDARRGETSWAHQIATVISYTTSVQNLAADPQTILDNPAVDFIKKIPVDWDETVVLPNSKIGDLLAFARRKGNDWFLCLINGDTANSKKVNVGLSFLGAGSYNANIVKDNLTLPAAVILDSTTVTASGSFDIEMRAGGGWAARLSNPNAVSLKPAGTKRASYEPMAWIDGHLLRMELPDLEDYSLTLFDPSGKRLYSRMLRGSGPVTWALPAKMRGIHMLRIKSATHSSLIKLQSF